VSRSRGRPKASPKTALRRPYVLTPEVQGSIIEFLTHGNFLRTACEAAGTTYRCFRHWQRRWEGGNPDAQIFADFLHAIKKAVALGEINALRNVLAGGPGWQGSAWFLERRFPERWARKDIIVVKGVRDLSELTDDELNNYLQKGK